jgi:uncharacterized protein (DUF2062 family)
MNTLHITFREVTLQSIWPPGLCPSMLTSLAAGLGSMRLPKVKYSQTINTGELRGNLFYTVFS